MRILVIVSVRIVFMRLAAPHSRRDFRMNQETMNSGRFGGPQPFLFHQKCRLCRCFWIRPKGALARPTGSVHRKRRSRSERHLLWAANPFMQPDFARNFREKIQKSGSSFLWFTHELRSCVNPGVAGTNESPPPDRRGVGFPGGAQLFIIARHSFAQVLHSFAHFAQWSSRNIWHSFAH